MDSVEFICSLLFFPNPSSQPLLTLYIFHFFLWAPFYPFVFKPSLFLSFFFVPRFILFPAVLEQREALGGLWGSYKPRKQCTIKKELLAKQCSSCIAGRDEIKDNPHYVNSTTAAQLGSINILSALKPKASLSSSLLLSGVLKIFWVAIWLHNACSNQIWAQHITACRNTASGALATQQLKKPPPKLLAGCADTHVCDYPPFVCLAVRWPAQ